VKHGYISDRIRKAHPQCCRQWCGSGMFIPDPGSEFFPSWIRNFSISNSGSSSKNLSIFTQKIVSKLSETWSGLFIPDPDFLPIPDHRSRGPKGTRSRIRIRHTGSRSLNLRSQASRLEIRRQFFSHRMVESWNKISVCHKTLHETMVENT